ncbi:MAG TPA: hypothetical protein VGG64_01160 [Pirellulales bacterium]
MLDAEAANRKKIADEFSKMQQQAKATIAGVATSVETLAEKIKELNKPREAGLIRQKTDAPRRSCMMKSATKSRSAQNRGGRLDKG